MFLYSSKILTIWISADGAGPFKIIRTTSSIVLSQPGFCSSKLLRHRQYMWLGSPPSHNV